MSKILFGDPCVDPFSKSYLNVLSSKQGDQALSLLTTIQLASLVDENGCNQCDVYCEAMAEHESAHVTVALPC